jgi:hypothetical protein
MSKKYKVIMMERCQTEKIMIKQCKPRECPYCLNDPFNKCNWCGYTDDPERLIPIRLMSFPGWCPLPDAEAK